MSKRKTSSAAQDVIADIESHGREMDLTDYALFLEEIEQHCRVAAEAAHEDIRDRVRR